MTYELYKEIALKKQEVTREWQVPELPAGTFGEQQEMHIEHVTLGESSFMHVSLDSYVAGRGIPPGDYAVFRIHDRPWMSDTPAELFDLLDFLSGLQRISPQRVLITGLGLGIAVKMALATESVERIDLIEIDPHVAEFVGSFWQEEAKKAGKQLNITIADALSVWPEAIDPDGGTGWDLAWHDIWPEISSDNLSEMSELEERFPAKLTLHWAKAECRGMMMEDEDEEEMWT